MVVIGIFHNGWSVLVGEGKSCLFGGVINSRKYLPEFVRMHAE